MTRNALVIGLIVFGIVAVLASVAMGPYAIIPVVGFAVPLLTVFVFALALTRIFRATDTPSWIVAVTCVPISIYVAAHLARVVGIYMSGFTTWIGPILLLISAWGVWAFSTHIYKLRKVN